MALDATLLFALLAFLFSTASLLFSALFYFKLKVFTETTQSIPIPIGMNAQNALKELSPDGIFDDEPKDWEAMTRKIKEEQKAEMREADKLKKFNSAVRAEDLV